MTNLAHLWLPFVIVTAVVAVYALLFRALFARPVQVGLAAGAFAGSLVLVGIGIAIFFFAKLEGVLVTGLLGGLQQATGLGGMLRLALIYAALPEEALKIGVVVLLLLIGRRQIRHPNDAAQLLLFSALGFALPESLLYVCGFASMPEFQTGLPAFALMRGALGALLHLLLGLIAGLCLLRVCVPGADGWRRRWIWFLPSYLLAVLAHAAFDGSLLRLIFQSLAEQQGQQSADIDLTTQIPAILPTTLIVIAVSLTLTVCGLVSLWRILRADGAPTALSTAWRAAGGCVLLLAAVLIALPGSLPIARLFDLTTFGAAMPRAFGGILLVLGIAVLMKRRPMPVAHPLDGAGETASVTAD